MPGPGEWGEYLTEAREMPRSSRPEMNSISYSASQQEAGDQELVIRKQHMFHLRDSQQKTWPGFCKNIDVMKDKEKQESLQIKRD